MQDMTKPTFSNASYTEFPTIQNKGIDEMPYERTYSRTTVTQQTLVEGDNKAIILNDGTNTRILIGYQKDGF